MKKLTVFLLLIIFISCDVDYNSKIILWGDSHIVRYNNKHWFPGFLSENNGVSGLKINDLKNNFELANEELIIIQIGTNDILNRLIENENCENIIDSVTDNYLSLIEVLENFDRVIITSIIPTTKNYINSNCDITHIYYTINQNLENILLSYPNLEFINLKDVLYDENKYLRDEYSNDGIHINYDGYGQITNTIYEIIY
jgi:lysophospholipase L1-like esterase